ncbi:BNR-4 repeat-containing protein [Isoptericola sp. BMS4]|uniref:BNR-4 repeat-containing protein n=1 Tax=Isoptericola sp. BMS4 TaxID=2527875 RepID=UPI00141EC74D|nr:BNR-4 repeat-containing protein [Isoptericola sp. BMS4]
MRRHSIPRRPTALAAAATALAAAATVGAATPPATADAPHRAMPFTAQVGELPFPVDPTNNAGWWTPLDVVDGVTYVAYDAPAADAGRHEVHVAARGADGTWTDGCLQAGDGGCVTFLDDSGHNQPSIIVDGDGYIHAFASMHHVPWQYYRSTAPGDVTSLVDVSSEMPDQGVPITYPVTARGTDGDVYVMVRGGRDGATIRDGRLYRYDTATHDWSRVAVFASATGASVYPDDLEVGTDGRLHVLWEWHRWAAGPYRHAGSYAVYDPADGSWSDAAGNAVTTPITPDAGGAVLYQPFAAGETLQTDAPTVQTAKLAVHGDELAGVVYRYAEALPDGTADRFDVRFARWDGSAWQRETIVDAEALGSDIDTIAALDATSAGGITRAYAVVTGTVDGAARSKVVRAEQVTGETSWRYGAIGGTQPGQQRIAARTTPTGADVLYLSASQTGPTSGTLFVADVPRTGGAIPGEPLADVVADVSDGGDGDDGGTVGDNLALGATTTVSSVLRADTGGEKAVDGGLTDDSRWVSAVGDTTPTITVDWGAAEAVSTVRVHSGYRAAIDPASAVLRDFTVELHTPAGWAEVGRYTGSTAGVVTVPVPDGTSADRLRLVATDPSASDTDVARVFEIEVLPG